jgi:predicted nuclease of predicted toxin-antitoxin system
MRLLFDQGTPLPLRKHLADHTIATAFEKGWNELENGDLLTAAEADGFDALITTDQNLRYQQNLSGRKIAVVVILTTNWPRIESNISLVLAAIDKITASSYQEVSCPNP